MVLSRKKLREKLRTLLAADSDTKGGAADHGKEDAVDLVESVKERLREARLKRPRPTRPKRKKKPALGGEEKEEKGEGETEGGGDEGSNEKKAVKKEKKKKKKKEKKEKKKDKKEENRDEKMGGEDRETGTATAGSGMKGSSEQNVSVPSVPNSSTQPTESFREEIAKKVYIGGIPYYSTEDDIKSFFEGCGTVTDIDCMKFPETGKFRGIAILTFKTESAAKRAISLDGSDMGGFYLKIQPYKGKGASKPDFSPQTIEGYNRIYIGNLSWDITEDDLKNLFKSCKISSIRFGTDKATGDFKGYVHVDFEERDSLAIALKLDQQVVRGRPVRIRCAVPRRASESGNDTVKKASDDNNDVFAEEGNSVRTGEENEVHKKQKRRTCYECGTPGHLSSACPNKKTNVLSNNAILQEDVNEVREEEAVDTTQEGSVRKKQKRRTCYECGTPGHLSSDCPNKKAIIASNDTILNQDVQQEPDSMIRAEEDAVDTQEGSVRKKKKRRTCYECGTPGHLSSECPNKTS